MARLGWRDWEGAWQTAERICTCGSQGEGSCPLLTTRPSQPSRPALHPPCSRSQRLEETLSGWDQGVTGARAGVPVAQAAFRGLSVMLRAGFGDGGLAGRVEGKGAMVVGGRMPRCWREMRLGSDEKEQLDGERGG